MKASMLASLIAVAASQDVFLGNTLDVVMSANKTGGGRSGGGRRRTACDVSTLDFNNPSPACLAPVQAEKRNIHEPDSFIPSVFSRIAFAPSTHGVHDLDLGTYTGQGKILVYGTSKYLLETAHGKLFNTGHHSSEMFTPLYHFGRAGFEFVFVTSDGAPIAIEEWTFPMATAADGFPAFEDKLRATSATHQAAMNSPKLASEVDPDLSGYLAIFIPGGHAPLIDMHQDRSLGLLLRRAHEIELPILSLCHGPSALRSAALGGEFPFRGYKVKIFPDATDDSSPSLGYLPGHLKPEDHAAAQLVALGMELEGTELDDSVHQDRELITGMSNLAAQNFAEFAITSLLAKYQS